MMESLLADFTLQFIVVLKNICLKQVRLILSSQLLLVVVQQREDLNITAAKT